jgi:predicted Zn-dependent peptidase
MPKAFKKIVLQSGLKVVLVPKKDSPTTTVLVIVATGSKYETKKINGISHFLEHLCFKGTKKRPSALAITSELDSLGAEYNAFTGEEYTGYHAKVASRHTAKILDIVSDLYLNPIFPEAEIEKEKGVIIEEINMYEDLPMRKVHEVLTELLYGNQPAGRPIAGGKDIIKRLTKNDIVQYRREHYVTKATTVVVSGSFDEKKVLSQIKKRFYHANTGHKSSKLKTNDSQSRPAAKVQYKKSDQSHLVLAFRAYPANDRRRFTLNVLADILGGGMSSRLFQKVRDELGAAYYVRASVEAQSDTGFLAISAGVDHKKLDTVIKASLGECKKIRSGDISDQELERAKSHLIGKLMIGLETSDEVAVFYGSQEIVGKDIKSPKEIAKRINAVTKGQIIKVAKEVFKNRGLNLALVGPYTKPGRFKKILGV